MCYLSSHKQFRAMLKKLRRKKMRQKIAREREQLELLGNIFISYIIAFSKKLLKCLFIFLISCIKILEQQKLESSPSYREQKEEIRRNSELYEQFEERER